MSNFKDKSEISASWPYMILDFYTVRMNELELPIVIVILAGNL